MHFMSVYKLVQTGELPAAKIGSRWKIDPGQLDDWIARQGGQARRWLLLGPDQPLAEQLGQALGGGHQIEAVPFGAVADALDGADVVLINAAADHNAALAALAVVHRQRPRPFCLLLVDVPTRALVVGALEVGLVSLLSIDDLRSAADEVGAALHWT